MIYPDNLESRIGFDTIRREIERRCASPGGHRHCQQMAFSTDVDLISSRLEQTDEMTRIITSGRDFPTGYSFDFRPILRGISAPGSFLTAEQLFQLQRLLAVVDEILRFFATVNHAETPPYPRLNQLAAQMQVFPDIAAEIGRILDRSGNIKDNASPELQQLRSTLASLEAGLAGTMRRIIARGRQEGYFEGDVQPNVRDGRLVLPVAPMHKRRIRGIVHDESASGKTIFIEPEEIVETNNRIRETEAETAREIIRILTATTDLIRPHIDDLIATDDLLATFDFIQAKARFAIDVDAHLPHLHPEPMIEWYHAVHPALLLSLREQGKDVVPMNLELNPEQRIVLISGPNAGGKSVCLKTVGVVQYMTQCGVLPTLYDNSHVGVFSDIFIDIGDQQSIEDDLSTYSSHLQNMRLFLNRGNTRSLILIDEFGSGTEPQIGGAIAQAILQRLNEQKVYGVITTHYQNLKHFAEDTPGIVNGAMLYDRGQMRPLFQLSVGYPGSSFAIEIARKIGLDPEVIEQAAQIVGSDYINMDRYLLDLVRDRRYWQSKRHEIRLKEKRLEAVLDQYEQQLGRIAQERREIIHQARSEARQILEQSNAQVEQTIRSIREMQAEKEKTKQVRQSLDDFKRQLAEQDADNGTDSAERLQQLQPRRRPQQPKKKPQPQISSDRPLQAGDNVVMKGQTTVGTVISVDEKYAIVAFGMLKTRVETSRLERTTRKADSGASRTSSVSRATANDIRERQLHFKPDIDVRGMRADEAAQAIIYFIDDAIQFDAKRVRILHGTGTGALRQTIRQYLDTIPGVRSYRDEHVQFGGAGITVVDLD